MGSGAVEGGRATADCVGVLGISDVRRVPRSKISKEDARLAGYPSLAALLRELDRTRRCARSGGSRSIGPGRTRAARCARRPTCDAAELASLRGRLDRMDKASKHGPWTRETLALIAARPAVLAAELAESVGRERLPFKRDVRKLKELGLTESLERGYRLSPRGHAFLDAEEAAATGRLS